MKRLWCCVAVVGLTGCSFAPVWAPMPMPDTLTRQEIESFRARADERLQNALRDCYQRFAVNDCRREALTRHREVLHHLRAQELRLNAIDREERVRKLESTPIPGAAPSGLEPTGTMGTSP
jgi:colicin import membrane protein